MSDFPAMNYKQVGCGEEEITLDPHEDEYDFLMKIVRSPRQPMSRRMRAAIEALPYRRPKLTAVAMAQLNGKDFATLLERAIERSAKERELKQIEGWGRSAFRQKRTPSQISSGLSQLPQVRLPGAVGCRGDGVPPRSA